MRVLWLVSLTQRLSRCLWTMVRPSRRRAPFGLQGGLITLLVRADRRSSRILTGLQQFFETADDPADRQQADVRKDGTTHGLSGC